MSKTGVDNIYTLSGGSKLFQRYIIYPVDDKVHRAEFSLRDEAAIILKREGIDDPLHAFLKNFYIVVRVENTGSPLPFFRAVYNVEIFINRTAIVEDSRTIGTLIGFMRLLDNAAKGPLDWHCHIFNFSDEGHKVKSIHGNGARSLSISMRMNRSHGRF
jgi:hypothetical protein